MGNPWNFPLFLLHTIPLPPPGGRFVTPSYRKGTLPICVGKRTGRQTNVTENTLLQTAPSESRLFLLPYAGLQAVDA